MNYKYINKNGWIDYNDSYTAINPINYISGDLQLTNDGLGIYSNSLFKPSGVTRLWNSTTNTFDFSELNVGDEITIRTEGIVTTSSNNQIFGTKIIFDLQGIPFSINLGQTYRKAIGTDSINRIIKFYIGSEEVRNTPAKWIFQSDSPATIIVNGLYISVQKR